MAGGKTGQADVGAGQTTDKQLGKANQRGYNVLVLPKRDFGLWYQWRGAGGMMSMSSSQQGKNVTMPGGKGLLQVHVHVVFKGNQVIKVGSFSECVLKLVGYRKEFGYCFDHC